MAEWLTLLHASLVYGREQDELLLAVNELGKRREIRRRVMRDANGTSQIHFYYRREDVEEAIAYEAARALGLGDDADF